MRERRTAGLVGLAAVAVAYYLGAALGFRLRFPPATTSVMWPPNSILAAALLLSPVRRWWRVVLAALPAHFLVELQAGLPLGLIGALFVTNCAEALLAAGLYRRWSDDPLRFDSLRRIMAFVVGAALLAPLLTSIADAAAVHVLRGEALDAVFVRRLLSNILSQLIITPSAVLLVCRARGWLRQHRGARLWPPVLLAAGHLVVGMVVLLAYHGWYHLPGGPFAALPLLLPLLLFAAVRSGPAGTSLSLLAIALLATGIAVWAPAERALVTAQERVLALQVFLIVVGAPLLCLSAVVEERRQAAATLRNRLRFEELVSHISAAFVHVPSHQMRGAFTAALERLGTFLGVDRAILFMCGEGGRPLAAAAAWRRAQLAATPAEEAVLPAHAAGALLQPPPLVCADRAELTPSAPERDLMDSMGAQSLLALPLALGGEVAGSLCLGSAQGGRPWPPAAVESARLVADVFASALARQRAEDALRASEAINSAVLASLGSGVAVLDRDGRIIAVNETWTRLACASGAHDAPGVGASFLDPCPGQPDAWACDAPETRAAIEAVLAGRAATFSDESPRATPSGDRWLQLTVVPLHRPEGGAVLTYTDVTKRRLAESEASRVREELAHCLRISTIGELTSSIAHELNQPLAAILANAQTGRRLLAGPVRLGGPLALDEILSTIISENRRAADVVRRVRLLLRQGTPEVTEIDVNTLAREMLELIANDALIREVALRQDLTSERVVVRGDRVQLRQVLLNLLLNALEALASRDGERAISVSTQRQPGGRAVLAVEDTGPGLPAGAEGDVFQPFYTTKARGMGMGLSIARSIVEAHGGAITARAAPAGGAVFTFTLPLWEPA
jgi:signal transduction histidine kinase/integral membrane sensor domain MASE1